MAAPQRVDVIAGWQAETSRDSIESAAAARTTRALLIRLKLAVTNCDVRWGLHARLMSASGHNILIPDVCGAAGVTYIMLHRFVLEYFAFSPRGDADAKDVAELKQRADGFLQRMKQMRASVDLAYEAEEAAAAPAAAAAAAEQAAAAQAAAAAAEKAKQEEAAASAAAAAAPPAEPSPIAAADDPTPISRIRQELAREEELAADKAKMTGPPAANACAEKRPHIRRLRPPGA